MLPSLELDLHIAARGSRLASLHAALREAIAGGRLAPGLRLPSSRELAAQVGVSRNTAVAAYELLASEGWLESRGGAGSFVAELPRAVVQVSDRASVAPWADSPWLRGELAVMPPPASRGPAPAWRFMTGTPDIASFPFDVLRRLQTRALQAVAREPARYSRPQGLPALREAIAGHVSSARAVACTADDVIITAGAQQAFDLIARVLVAPGRTLAAVEDPGYPPLRAALAASGARLAPVPVDREGLVVDALPAGARIVCVTPSHQFPLGVALSLARRRELLNWAAREQAVIVEDDYDGEFRFTPRPLDALKTLDRDGRVFYVGTLSKSMLPVLRIGFIVAPAWAREALIAARQATDFAAPALMQMAVADFIAEGHLLRHVRRMRAEYAERRRALEHSLRQQLGARADIYPAIAGLHLAAALPVDCAALAQRAWSAGVGVEPLSRYRLAAEGVDGLVFGYGAIGAARIPEAVRRLAEVLGTL
ncbi:MocR-like pyridoxine biosynthesis transcription factor PdxR [Pelomonas aquatica]|jgi:GntR family transcriptional regulator/MocR family aminotransferase|uniref:PLP-dependent aminotransferase family protein n=1 Tax=Pelomonas aquatica TaxID=431058 RepID=A0A9X4LKT2_9BURK|nr:PLP-dependent aminotransferase family protein [Pelomonas aquatica]MCY4755764.1 PLP-dependent aminotransferase family protein [Pelomonas aquatica]MDG0865068.1 PLP-dependent aminotransferase family protein [Pelomonas aquatica]